MADIIAAIATGKQISAIGILRVSGPGCPALCDKVFRTNNGRPLSASDDRKLVLGSLLDEQGRVIDQAMAVVSRAPHSYTGEDTVEFQCHGSPAVLVGGLRALFRAGARQAGPGEFTKRAFLNGKMDLTQAEAVVDLIDAETIDAAANAAGQVGGALLRRIDPIYNELRDLMSHYHAVLDYPDEDIDAFELSSYAAMLVRSCKDLEALLSTYSRGQILKKGIRAVILGKPNVGKSSFLNTLAGYERVIVTDIAGTTRDSVEESVRVGSHLLRLLDTAGIHETEDVIERMGVNRAEAALKDADLAICVVDGSRPLDAEDEYVLDLVRSCENCLTVQNKTDLPQVVEPADLFCEYVIPFSSVTGEGMDYLESALDMMFGDEAPTDGSILTNERQAGAVYRARQALLASIRSMRTGLTPDAVLCDVENAMEALGEVTGRTFREDIVNRIFERFCVGK